jgi:biopolymer transport protein ExbB
MLHLEIKKVRMKRFFNTVLILFAVSAFFPIDAFCQDTIPELIPSPEGAIDGFHQMMKTRFIEGSAIFMSFIALAFILGLAFCLERIIYLNLAQINTKKFLSEIEGKLTTQDVDGALEIARDTRGPVASICYQALSRIKEDINAIDKSITSFGSVQTGLLEKNLSWISLFIAVAPSLGFLGTVIGMIMSFDNIQQYGDINPVVIAQGMKVALITTVGGLIVAIILQFFYNYILSKVEEIVTDMEDDSIKIMDMIIQYKHRI